jgi:hypothetical protein
VSEPWVLPPCEQGSRKIQLPYLNKFDSIWEYKKFFLSRRIDFRTHLGPSCPICGKTECYRQITPYWRYAIDLFPRFKKDRIPIARFLCRAKDSTFSLLPIQLIPYFQYTAAAVVGTLLLGFQCWQTGQQGFFGAMLSVDPESMVTPWLVAYWLRVIQQGLRRGHAVLGRFYDLSRLRSPGGTVLWQEAADYFLAFGYKAQARWGPWLRSLVFRYTHITGQFLFGTPSQQRTHVFR